MEHHSADDVRESLAPLASLLSKSEKAQQKVVPGTWQHAILGDNIKSLRVALEIIGGGGGESSAATLRELEEALAAIDAMIVRVEGTKAKFAVGTSQYSLQRNRLKALHVARSAVMVALDAH